MNEEYKILKEEGKQNFTEKKYNSALSIYKKCLDYLINSKIEDTNEKAILLINQATCNYFLENYEEALLDADRSLNINPGYLKGHYRKAQILIKQEKVNEAFEACQKALNIEKNHEILELIVIYF